MSVLKDCLKIELASSSPSKSFPFLSYSFPLKPILGIDAGEKRVGIAISHTNGTAYPLICLKKSRGRAESLVIKIINQLEISEVVVGFPFCHKSEDLKEHPSAKFIRRLERRITAKITRIDEYLSSIEAEDILKGELPLHKVNFFTDRIKRMLKEENLSNMKNINNYEKNKKLRECGIIDMISAAIILQRFLDKK